MKKTLQIISLSLMLALALPFATLNAQIFDKGDVVINAGIGLGSTVYHGAYYKTTVPPLFLSGDYCLMEDLGPGNLGVGAYLGYSAYKWEYSSLDYGWKYSTIIIAARGTYHFVDLVDKLDLYGGVLLGAKIVSHKYFGDDLYSDTHTASGSGAAFSVFGGARYYFTDNLGAMAELGYGIAWLSLGVSLKF
jgi:hypothetical protein